MPDKVTKTVKVPESEAGDWDDYVDENAEVDSMSHLIRLAVHREIKGQHDGTQRQPSGESGGTSEEIEAALRRIQTSIDDVEDRLTALDRAESTEEHYDFEKAIYHLLPTPPEPIDAGARTSSDSRQSQVPSESHPPDEWATTPEDLADKIGASVPDVKMALEQLHETGQVQSAAMGEPATVYFYRSESR